MFNIRSLGSERSCELALARIMFGSEICCPGCRSRLSRGQDYWWCGHCRKKHRVKAVSWLKDARISYRELFVLVSCWQKRLSPGSVKHLTSLPYPTIRRWFSRFRVHLPKETALLDGVVEVDEAFFGRQKHFNQRIVIGAIERKSGQIRLAEIPDREQDSLEGFLFKNVATTSLLHTDCHAGYYDLGWNGYGHQLHNHSLGHFRGTNRIENVWSVAKRSIRRSHGQIRTEHLGEYLQEWEARRNFPELFTNPLQYLKGVCSVIVH